MQIVLPGIHGNGRVYLDILKSICGETEGKSMIDLMCHHAPYTPLLGFAKRTYVDCQDRGLDFSEEQQHFVKSDVHLYTYENSHMRYDVAICSDGIEHLPKQSGFDLLLTMRLQAHKAIIFTPLGDCFITLDNHPDSHKSGWMPQDIPGWATIVLPDFHPTLGIGAFFAFVCGNLSKEFERVKQTINQLSWIK